MEEEEEGGKRIKAEEKKVKIMEFKVSRLLFLSPSKGWYTHTHTYLQTLIHTHTHSISEGSYAHTHLLASPLCDVLRGSQGHFAP
jgi:hypothetical protein